MIGSGAASKKKKSDPDPNQNYLNPRRGHFRYKFDIQNSDSIGLRKNYRTQYMYVHTERRLLHWQH
jgi:hypothetical protein